MTRKRHDSEALSDVSLGLLPSNYDQDDRMGHVWLLWCARQTYLQEFRGYWPHPEDYAHIPAGERRKYFYENSARGLIMVDYRAKEFMRRYGRDTCRFASWLLTDDEKIFLEFLCWIPPQTDSREDGRYSCNLNRNDWHNCSSWVKSVFDRIGGADSFFTCKQPKRLKYIQLVLWGETW